MHKPGLAALIGLAMVWGASSAQAQVMYGRPTFGTSPGRAVPFGSAAINPLLYGSAFGSPGVIVGGVGIPLGGFRPGMGVNPVGPGAFGFTGPGGTAAVADNPALDMNQGFVTGHPVAFQNHRGFFLNLNAAAGNPSLTVGGGTTQPGTPNPGILGNQTNTPGKRPARPRDK